MAFLAAIAYQKSKPPCHRISPISAQGCSPACVTINRVKPETPELNPRLAKRTKRLYSGDSTRWARLPKPIHVPNSAERELGFAETFDRDHR